MFRPTYISSSDPTVNDDFSEGYTIGICWLNSSSGDFFICTDNSEGAASWITAHGSISCAWKSWTPSLLWTGNTPTGVSSIARTCNVGKTCFFTLQISGTNGVGTTLDDVSSTLPLTANDNDNVVPVEAYILQSTAYSRGVEASVNLSTGTTDPSPLKIKNMKIGATNTFTIYISGQYETV